MPDARPPTVFVSTPTTRLDFAAAVLPLERHRAFQALLGYESQLAGLEAGLRSTGVTCLFLPAPEIFGHPAALAALRRFVPAPAPLVHLRFGAVRSAKLLKGATNLFVAGENASVPPIDLGRHPFGDGDTLPQQMNGVLSYDRRHRLLRNLAGAVLPGTMLPEAAISADLDLAPAGAADGWPALQAQSLFEFDLAAWGAPSTLPPDEPSALSSPALRSADLHAALSGDAPRRLVALPWNLAHAGGIVPDLVMKVVRRRDPATGLLLLPFNVDGDALAVVTRLAGHVRDATEHPREALGNVFVARMRRPRNAQALSRLAPVAWLDASDPETEFTRRRLARLGIAGILLTGDITRTQTEGVSAVFAADEPRQTDLRTAFGPQQQRSVTVSGRALGRLLALSGTLGAAPPPRRTREAVRTALRPLAALLLPGAIP